ncbi:Gfo/Idh/MocA family oxidoreductase [Roseospira marina]|uniref:Gfo/Idh/MocA family oxidoreductase n=1 Tax=Roseospira marina TaxID=140057 RepID=A0A5M6ICN8_9PROT|nr:Gfo/Idh/MocA family oxidoreductase [Roseospira marina]KAA5606044.1 Gfo/Idh/MocA family oxidoreductase [Roseospira marina]MBB4313095.1 putative dehydrogenase [Roseospira marina]MBB5086164.1 putative dehydrogenase [Roseospira marina]
MSPPKSSAPPLRVGIIGGGHNSAVGGAHVAAIRMDGAYRIGPCLFSHLEDENRLSHEHYGLPWEGHGESLETWLNRHAAEMDMVVVLTPSTDHVRHIQHIIGHGLSFLTEKPVACSLGDAAAVRDALNLGAPLHARFVHNYSGYPLFREMVLRLEDGDIGRIHHVRVHMPSDGFAREHITGKPQLWRQTDPEIPMLMLDLGTHMHHLVRMAVGPSPSRVRGRMHRMVNSLGVIDNVEIWEERADDIRVSYWMSKAHLGVKNGLGLEVYGRDGALIWHQMDPDHLIRVDTDSNRTIINRGAIRPEAARRDRFKAGHPTGFVEAFGAFYSDLAEDIAASAGGSGPGNRWIRPITDAFEGLAFLAAAARSHDTGAWEEP